MKLGTILKNSLLLPKKDALFKLNRMNMRDTLVFINLLFLILFLPDAIRFVQNVKDTNGSIPDVVIIQVVFLYPALTIFLTTLIVTALAGISYLIRNSLNRKLAYHQLWKMTSYALTWPIIIFLFIKIFMLNLLFILISIVIFLYLITKMILIYPKRHK
ncbi:DUF1189 family protein [Piscibacillus salipiscarius]|uniref:DUF1189 family protein n=1 Tax=Piscibacillus salipiscarius TaxID=299480 RepID=A0ABW5Q7J1_9BACI|nr:DUF1189 family protein [Piscibacillus salipiscarius]